jgi:hypothetical protein
MCKALKIAQLVGVGWARCALDISYWAFKRFFGNSDVRSIRSPRSDWMHALK